MSIMKKDQIDRLKFVAENCIEKEPDELTDEEKFAIAFFAGCKTGVVRECGQVSLKLLNNILITKDGNMFFVYESAR